MKETKKVVIGILGAPGAGKSSLSAIFAQNGCGVINADQLNHEVMRDSEIKSRIASEFGREIIGGDGEIDRKVLSQKVFGDGASSALKRLTDIVHPEILKLMKEQMVALTSDSSVSAIVLDVPLLLEVGWERMCDKLVYIEVEEQKRHERLRNNRGWDEKLIKSIENSQILLDKKRKISDYIVENNSDIDVLRTQVLKILPEILINQVG